MRWNFNGLQARLSAAFLLVSVGIAAFVALAFRMDQATIERAARLEAEHVALTLVPPSLKDAIHKPALLQAFVDGAHSNYNRDVVIVDTRKVGIADIAHEELGQVYDQDLDNEVGRTVADGAPRTFVERSTQYPDGAMQLVVPLRAVAGDPLSPIVGAIILEYTPIYRQLLAAERVELLEIAAGGAGCVLFSTLFGWRVARGLSLRIKALQRGVVGIDAGDYGVEVTDSGKDEIGALGQAFNKMTEDLKVNQNRLIHMAHHDALTQLPNRVLIYDRLQQALARARRRSLKAALMFIDLDRFKAINDTLGHAGGDQLLRQVSQRLSDCLDADDTIGRLGGDEFAVVLADRADAQDAATIAERLLEALRPPMRIDGHEAFISASIGVAVFPSDGNGADALLKNADAAMYRAKEAGRANVQFYTAEMNQQAMENLKLETNLRHALDREEFALHFQPKVSLTTGLITGFEALLRWRRPDQTLVSPASFIPVLEQTGLIVPVGVWVLRAACAQIRTWRRANLTPLPIAINLSARQFRRQDICDVVKSALVEFEVHPRELELEITESTAMEDADQAIATLRALRALGVHVAIDDFGTGYSSLSYLKRLPVDSIKIDRSFVSQVASQRDDAAIARAIITMAHSLQLKVIAEGVETADQLAFLTANGCDEVQGYYFSRPLPGADCAAMLGRPRQLKGPRGPSSPPPDSGRRVAIEATPCEEPACVERATMVAALSTGAQQTAMSSGGSRS